MFENQHGQLSFKKNPVIQKEGGIGKSFNIFERVGRLVCAHLSKPLQEHLLRRYYGKTGQ